MSSPKEENDEINQKEITETLNFEKPDFVFLPKGYHVYRQQGPYLVCKSCEIQHAIFIGMEKVMVGVDEKGQPILKKKSV